MMNKNKFNHAIAANVFYLADYDERKSLEKLNDIDLIEYMNKYWMLLFQRVVGIIKVCEYFLHMSKYWVAQNIYFIKRINVIFIECWMIARDWFLHGLASS